MITQALFQLLGMVCAMGSLAFVAFLFAAFGRRWAQRAFDFLNSRL